MIQTLANIPTANSQKKNLLKNKITELEEELLNKSLAEQGFIYGQICREMYDPAQIAEKV